MFSGKAVVSEESVVPRVPWLTDRQRMIPGRFSQIDVVPTLLNSSASRYPIIYKGQSRVDVSKMKPRWMATTS